MKRGDTVIRRGERYFVARVEGYGPDEQVSLVREGSLAYAAHFPMTDLRSHEPPRTPSTDLPQDGLQADGPSSTPR